MDKCVDIELSLLLSNDKPQLAAELLGLLLSGLPQNHHDISRAFAELRFGDALEFVHKLHGTCCYCGVPQLQQACKKLERQLRAKLHAPAPEDVHTFNECIGALLAWHQHHDIDLLFSLDK